MPNHITNHIQAEPDIITKIRSLMENGKKEFDFNKVIPMPPNSDTFLAEGNLGKKEEEKYGRENTWYEWSIKYWGTKWNAYHYRREDDSFYDERNDDSNIYFETAWAMPMPVCEALAKALQDYPFSWEWADEDIGSNFGRVVMTKGHVYESDIGGSCVECWCKNLKGCV